MEVITGFISIKMILECKRKSFCNSHKGLIRETVLINAQKILDCGSNLGFASYKCEHCGEVKHIHFTCKSRFCNSCSKPQSDLRTDKLYSRIPRGIGYHHIVLTIPEELRDFFKRHRNTLSILPKVASNAICYFLWEKQKSIPGIIAVIHTFGAKLNRNPHVHLLVTHGAYSTKQHTFSKEHFYLPYEAIRCSRTKYLLKHLKERVYANIPKGEFQKKEIRFLNSFYEYKNKEGKTTTRYGYFSEYRYGFETIIGYIGRYVKRPTIAQSRILDYDGNTIIFNYKDKMENNETKNIICSDMEFLELLVQHIPNKHFHMVYYYGIFANRIKQKYISLINTLYPTSRIYPRIAKNFKQRFMLRNDNDPFKCNCGGYFHKFKITIPGYKTQYFDTS